LLRSLCCSSGASSGWPSATSRKKVDDVTTARFSRALFFGRRGKMSQRQLKVLSTFTQSHLYFQPTDFQLSTILNPNCLKVNTETRSSGEGKRSSSPWWLFCGLLEGVCRYNTVRISSTDVLDYAFNFTLMERAENSSIFINFWRYFSVGRFGRVGRSFRCRCRLLQFFLRGAVAFAAFFLAFDARFARFWAVLAIQYGLSVRLRTSCPM